MNVAGVARGRLALARARLWTRSRGRGRPRAGAAAAAVSLALGLALAWALATAFGGLRDAGLPEASARALLAWLFTAALTGVLVFDLHEALAGLVAAPDLDLLRAAPLAPRSLAALRLAFAAPRSLPLVLVLALPASIGFVAGYGLPASGLAGAALALAALWLAPLGAGLALALPLARLLPPARARDVLGLLATFALVAAWLANALLVPRAGVEALGPGGGPLAALPAPPAALPSAWAAEAFATRGAGIDLRLALVALAGAALAWWSTRRHLEAALDRTQEAPRRVAARAVVRVAGSWTTAFLARDARLFGRQWTVAADVVAASLLWMLLPLVSVPLYPVAGEPLARAMLVLLGIGIGYEVGARALALEREGLAWSRLAPGGARRWLAGRLAGVSLLALALIVPAGAAVAVTFRLPAAALPALAEWTLAAGALSIALGLLTGAAFADPAWTHPRAMLGTGGRLVGTVLLVLQAGLWLWLGTAGPAAPPGFVLLAGLAGSAAALAWAARKLGTRPF